jgi:hypothetical protein
VRVIRRSLLLATVAVVTLAGLAVAPALAAFTVSATMPAVTIGTAAVTPPTGLSTAGTTCVVHTDSLGNTYTTLEAMLSWVPSPTAAVTSYDLTAHAPGGWTYPVTTVDAGTTTVSGSVDGSYASQGLQLTVTARTSYGWTAESERSGVLTC